MKVSGQSGPGVMDMADMETKMAGPFNPEDSVLQNTNVKGHYIVWIISYNHPPLSDNH